MIEERLLNVLRGHANTGGIVPIREDTLLAEVGSSRKVVGLELDRLERAGLVKIFAPLPFLVVKLRKWPDQAGNTASSGSRAYSYSKLSNDQLKNSYRSTSESALMREILETLGETDPASFEGAIANYPAEVIRKALDRVRRTRSLRKNRTALFRYLLTKLA